MAVCYRHPGRETGVSCANCGRPICTDCMTSTSVGMRCPECSKQTTKVKHVRATSSDRPVVTTALIVLNVLIYFGTASQGATTGVGGSSLISSYALNGPAVEAGEWYRLISAGFLHAGIIHVGFNMYILWFLGNLLEPRLGPVRFGALYAASLLAGSFGALLLTPLSNTVGASGAIFGLMGAVFVMDRARGLESGVGMLILLNLGISFVLPGISIGGHIGGLVGGAAAGWLIEQSLQRRVGNPLVVPVLICVVVGAAAVAASFAVAGGSGLNVGLLN